MIQVSIFEYDQELHMKTLKEEYKEEGKREGLMLGTVKTMKKMKMPESSIIEELMAEFNLPKDEAVNFIQCL